MLELTHLLSTQKTWRKFLRNCEKCLKSKEDMAFKGHSLYCRLCSLYLTKEEKAKSVEHVRAVSNKYYQEKYWRNKTRVRNSKTSTSSSSGVCQSSQEA
jgi:hypothetical protein